jgi:hypothetical protein
MSKILANQIANYLDNAPIEIKEGLNIPTGKPLQVNGSVGTNGQVLSTDGTGLVWANAPYFNGDYNALTNKPTIPAAQVNSDWNSNSGVTQILNKPIVPPVPSVTIAGSPSGNGSLTYNSSNGEFTFIQADLSSYLTTETDPVFLASDAFNVTAAKITNWDTAYGWGDHSTQSYITLTNISAATAAASGTGTLAYNNATGVFTLTPPDLSGYLTAESDTLATVTARGATTSADVTVNDMTVNGNLTVIGTTTQNNQSTLNVSATEITINDGQSGAPALNGSLKIDRGTGTDTAIRWNEGTDIWEFTNDGTTYNPIPTNNNQLTNGAGYLTSYTETDPVFGASPAGGITNTNITNWNAAYGWGDHSTAGYLTAEADTLDTITARGATTNNGITVGGITVNGNMTVNGTQTVINTTTLKVSDNEITLNNDVTGTPTENAGIEVERGLSANVRIRWDETSDRWQFTNNGSNYTNIAVNISDLPNDSGFISSYTETDPIFTASAASSITTQNLTNWNAAYNWGDHSTAGYLTSYTEADTLDTVTGRGATTSNTIQIGRLNVGSVDQSILPTGTNDVTFQNTSTGGEIILQADSEITVNNYARFLNSGDVVLNDSQFGTTYFSNGATVNGGNLVVTNNIVLNSGDLTTTGKLYYSNNFATTGDLPNATTYHGMFAHVHAEGHGYFAHGGLWTQLLDTGSALGDLADVSATAPNTNDVLTWNGSGWAGVSGTSGPGGAAGTSWTALSHGTSSLLLNTGFNQYTFGGGGVNNNGAIVAIEGASGTPGRLRLDPETDVGTAYQVYLTGPTRPLTDGGSGSYTIELPENAPTANSILESDANGKLSWIATPSGGGGGGPSTDTLADVTSRGATTTDDIFLGDSTKLGFGANGSRGDVELYYDQANLRYVFEDVSGCEFRFANNVGGNATAFSFLKGGGTLARMSAASVDLWAGGTQRLATTSTGVDITGDANIGGTSPLLKINNSSGTGYASFDYRLVGNAAYQLPALPANSGEVLSCTTGGVMSWTTTTYTETDPVFSASEAAGITSTDTTNWDTAYGWGNHANQGYLTSVGSINTLTDVNLTTPLTNQTLVYNGSQWVNSYGASGLQSRATAQASTGTLADGADANVTLGASKSYLLMKVQTSAAAWVTLYTDTGSRSSDSTRLETTDPAPGSGVIAEVITSAASTQIITPGVMGWNDDGTPSTNVYAKVVNKSGASANITVTITYVALEI